MTADAACSSPRAAANYANRPARACRLAAGPPGVRPHSQTCQTDDGGTCQSHLEVLPNSLPPSAAQVRMLNAAVRESAVTCARRGGLSLLSE